MEMPNSEILRVVMQHYLTCPDLDKQREAGPQAKWSVDRLRAWCRENVEGEIRIGGTYSV